MNRQKQPMKRSWTGLRQSVLWLALMTALSSGCSAAKTPQIVGTPDELVVYPPICVSRDKAVGLLEGYREVAIQIATHNRTINNRHGADTVSEYCRND